MEREEQIKQNAYNYAHTNDHNWVWDDSGENRVDISEEISEAYIQGAHSRDDEIKHITRIATTYKADAQDTVAECERLHDIIDKLRNPWISVEEHPDDVIEDYLLEYEDGSHIVAMWDSGMWVSKNLHPLKEPTHWMPIPKT